MRAMPARRRASGGAVAGDIVDRFDCQPNALAIL
jgi:hypothetical protein